jgi:flagellar biosynthesis chaperone FliJ
MKPYNIYTHKHDKNKIMNITEVRNVIRQVVAEAMEKGGLPKSGGKLVHLKKELAGLKKMKESLGSYTINEGGDGQFVAEYAHMQKFVTELEKIKAAHAKLSEMLDNQISEVEGKVASETEKVKEMMGLIEKAKAPKEKKEKKADTKASKSKHEKGESKAEEKEEHKMDEARFEKGEDIGKPGKGFAKIAKAAAKQYGSKEAGQKVAGAILKKVVAKGK